MSTALAGPAFKRVRGPALLLMGALTSLSGWCDQDAALMEWGRKLFTTVTPACATCHTLQDAGSDGAIGPVLDEIKPDSARVSKALHNGLGVMPSFKAVLTEAQMAALAHYVSRVTGGEK